MVVRPLAEVERVVKETKSLRILCGVRVMTFSPEDARPAGR
jgi:hypothetical protein